MHPFRVVFVGNLPDTGGQFLYRIGDIGRQIDEQNKRDQEAKCSRNGDPENSVFRSRF
jgi:hypothetical protein